MAASSQTQAKMRRFVRMLWTHVAYVAPATLIVIVGFILAYQFVRPAPPDRIVMATGHKDGAYFAYGQAYAERFRKEGFELMLSETAGSVENLGLLIDETAEVPVAFMQGGIGTPAEHPTLRSLGSLYFEPIWVFVRGPTAPSRLTGLAGKRIAVGAAGSGTRAVAYRCSRKTGSRTRRPHCSRSTAARRSTHSGTARWTPPSSSAPRLRGRSDRCSPCRVLRR
jgi:hypothetical protein